MNNKALATAIYALLELHESATTLEERVDICNNFISMEGSYENLLRFADDCDYANCLLAQAE